MHALFLLALLVLAGCGDSPVGVLPEEPPGAVLMPAPAAYAGWWAEVQADAGQMADTGSVRWHRVPGGPWWSDYYQARIVGRWYPDGRIYLADAYASVEAAVKHEMLHHVLQTASHDHPLFEVYR